MPTDSFRGPEAAPGEASAFPAHGAAPAGLVEARLPPTQGIAHPDEGEDTRGEWWTLLRSVAIGVVAIMLIGWLISR